MYLHCGALRLLSLRWQTAANLHPVQSTTLLFATHFVLLTELGEIWWLLDATVFHWMSMVATTAGDCKSSIVSATRALRRIISVLRLSSIVIGHLPPEIYPPPVRVSVVG